MSESEIKIKLIEWGMFAVAFAHFIVAWLEFKRNKKIDELKNELSRQLKLIKNLEEKQQNHKKEERSKKKILVKNFIEMHTSISKNAIFPYFLRNKLDNKEWLQLDIEVEKGEKEYEYDQNFFEQMRKIINGLNIKEEENSFVAVIKMQEPFPGLLSNTEKDETFEFIKWKKYKEIFSKSADFYNYFDNLNNSISDDSKKMIFSLNKLDSLYFKIFSS